MCWINELLVRLLDNQIVKVRAVTPPRGCGLFRLADRDTPKKVLFRIDVSSGSDLLSTLLSLKAGMQHLSQNSISALSCMHNVSFSGSNLLSVWFFGFVLL